MDPRPLQFIADACSGELLRGSPELVVDRICTDSREVRAGDVFFALQGDRFDGHEFVAEAARKAVGVVLARGRHAPTAGGCAVIAVEDTRKALGRLAARYRRDFALPVIAVGGSNGKTTTKDLIASVLNTSMPTLRSEASFNNDVGVPLTLLGLEAKHSAAVVEIGTNHPGELAPLAEIVLPECGVITSIGREHLEFFGDLDGVAEEEGGLAEALRPDGLLLVNGDEEWSNAIVRRARAPFLRVGFGDGNDWRVRTARLDRHGVTFSIECPDSRYAGEYRISLLGRHQAVNSLFAIALGARFGVGCDRIAAGLAECKPARMRMQLYEVNGVRVLDDAYNANADSMNAALQTMKELPCRGRRVAVLGDMAELGRHSEAAHEEVGRRAAELGVGQLFAVGKMACVMARGARKAGLSRVLEFEDLDVAGAAVKQFVKAGDLLLIKASRASGLERITQLLRNTDPARKNPGAPNGKQAHGQCRC